MDGSKELHESLFALNDDWQNDACVNQKVNHNFDLFAEGYKTAADILVKHVVEESSDQDTLVYPIVFLHRHHIELRLKEIIREGNRLLGNLPNNRFEHELQKLWPVAKGIIRKIWSDGEPDDFQFIDLWIREFCKVDPQSASFRYPENKGGRNPLANMSRINIKSFGERMGRISDFLYGISAAICDYNDS